MGDGGTAGVLEVLIERLIAGVAEKMGHVLTPEACHTAILESIQAGEVVIEDDAVQLRGETPRGPIYLRITAEPDDRQRHIFRNVGAN